MSAALHILILSLTAQVYLEIFFSQASRISRLLSLSFFVFATYKGVYADRQTSTIKTPPQCPPSAELPANSFFVGIAKT